MNLQAPSCCSRGCLRGVLPILTPSVVSEGVDVTSEHGGISNRPFPEPLWLYDLGCYLEAVWTTCKGRNC